MGAHVDGREWEELRGSRLDVRSRGEELLSSDHDNDVHDHLNDRCRVDIVDDVNVYFDRDQCSESESGDWNVREFRGWSASTKCEPRRQSSWCTAHAHGVIDDGRYPGDASRGPARYPRTVVGDDDKPSR